MKGNDQALTWTRLSGGRTRLTATLWLPRPLAEVFAFFADAGNLDRITPPWMHFHTTTPQPIVMGVGTMIDYRLRVHGWPLRWQSLISVWDPPHVFVDEQLRGPYRQWHHEHRFTASPAPGNSETSRPPNGDGPAPTDVRADAMGTLCEDRVTYAVPGGRLIEHLLVRRDLRTIFNYRQARLTDLLGT